MQTMGASPPPLIAPKNGPATRLYENHISVPGLGNDDCWNHNARTSLSKPATDVDELKQRLIETWSAISSFTDQAIDRWQNRFHASLKAISKHSKHLPVCVAPQQPTVNLSWFSTLTIPFRFNTTPGMQTRGLFFKPGFTGLTAFKPGYPGLTYGGSLVSGRLANRVL